MKLQDAYFFDNDRTVIKAIYRDENDNEIVRHIPAQESNKKYQEFMNDMETITGGTNPIDKLHERTMNYFRESQQDFKDAVMAMAKENKMIYDIDNINSDIYKAVAATIFSGNFDPEKDKEKLFMYKLTLFEMDGIKKCKNRELKSELRKAQNIMDATEIAIKIVKDTSDTSE